MRVKIPTFHHKGYVAHEDSIAERPKGQLVQQHLQRQPLKADASSSHPPLQNAICPPHRRGQISIDSTAWGGDGEAHPLNQGCSVSPALEDAFLELLPKVHAWAAPHKSEELHSACVLTSHVAVLVHITSMAEKPWLTCVGRQSQAEQQRLAYRHCCSPAPIQDSP